MSVGVDISEAPLESKGDEIGLSRQSRREAEAILLENSLLPRRAKRGGSVVEVALVALAAEHGLLPVGVQLADLLAGLRVRDKEELAVVRVLSSVEGADVAVEEGTLRVGARVVSAAVGNARLGEAVRKEGDDLRRHDVGDEGAILVARSSVARRRGRHGGSDLVVPGVVRDHEAVDEVGEDHLLVGSRRVGHPDGGDLLDGVVEEGGVHLGKAELNCGHFSRFCRVGREHEDALEAGVVMSVGGAAQLPIKTSIVINFFWHLNKKEGFFRHLSVYAPQTGRCIK